MLQCCAGGRGRLESLGRTLELVDEWVMQSPKSRADDAVEWAFSEHVQDRISVESVVEDGETLEAMVGEFAERWMQLTELSEQELAEQGNSGEIWDRAPAGA
jgi:hypothetical protein